MSIESEQLIISNKVISNDIMRNQDARSLTMKNGLRHLGLNREEYLDK